MDLRNREQLLNKIICGFLRFKVDGRVFFLKSVTPVHKYIADEIYNEAKEQAELNGAHNEEQQLIFLLENNFWSTQEQNQIKTLHEELEDLKVDLFQATFKSSTRKIIKEQIQKTKDKLEDLSAKRNAYSHLTSHGVAEIAKLRYLVGMALHTESGPVYTDFWNDDNTDLLDKIIVIYNNNKIDIPEFRELARTEPWRNMWVAKKATGDNIFGKSVVELTDDQRLLIYWTVLYDSVFENPDCPSDDVIDDDDALDGFLIKQRRDKKAQSGNNDIENQLSDKMKQCDEVFLVAETPEDAKKIYALNDEATRQAIQARERKIREKGIVHELELPDMKKKLKMAAVQKISGDVKARQ